MPIIKAEDARVEIGGCDITDTLRQAPETRWRAEPSAESPWSPPPMTVSIDLVPASKGDEARLRSFLWRTHQRIYEFYSILAEAYARLRDRLDIRRRSR